MVKSPFRYPAAWIRWNDAHARNQAVEYTDDEIKTQFHRPEECITLGLVIRDDAEGISLYNEQTGPDSVRGAGHIPRAMIKEVVYVNLTPLRKARHARTIAGVTVNIPQSEGEP